MEDVFREAREGTSSVEKTVVQETTHAAGGATSGAFAFDFNLGKKREVESTSPSNVLGGFSFSFFPPTQDKEQEKHSKAEGAVEDSSNSHTSAPVTVAETSVLNELQPQAPSFRRKGMQFPKDILERYQEDFYVMNDGLKILQDLDRFRHDEEVKSHWTQERQTLTKDWKRKRKFAQQARNKHHKAHKSSRHS